MRIQGHVKKGTLHVSIRAADRRDARQYGITTVDLGGRELTSDVWEKTVADACVKALDEFVQVRPVQRLRSELEANRES